MPSLDLYKKINSSKTIGQAHKQESDNVMNNTWWNDISSRVVYLYDYYHDLASNDPLKLRDLHPEQDVQKIPIDAKYLMNSSQTYSKDIVTFHLQLRPGQLCNVPYYEEKYGAYDAIFPVGLFVDIPDNNGQYNKWLVVSIANFYDTQFSTYEILPCDKVLQWIYQGNKYQMAGCLRSQNSYNSGIWTDYKLTLPEDQQKFIVPLNKISETLFYNQRMIIDNMGVETEPRTWHISKVNRLNANGTVLVTLAQTEFDDHTDYIERDSDGNIIGMWASYYSGQVTPTDPNNPDVSDIHAKISYKGAQNNQLKIGGSARTFIVKFYDKDIEIPYRSGTWSFTIDGVDASSVFSAVLQSDNTTKIKFIGGEDYMGKKAILTFTSGVVIASIDINIVGV